MLERIAKHWWLFLIRGIAGILFGLGAFLMPGITLAVLISLFGVFALADGVFGTIAAIRGRHEIKLWWAHLLEGLTGIAAGVVALLWPGITAVALLYVIAAWSIVTGVLQIVAAWRLREQITGEWALAMAGVLSAVFGGLLLSRPAAGALAVVWLIGAYATAFGLLLIVLALRIRRLPRELARAA